MREMMRSFSNGENLDEAALEGLASVAADFYDMLAVVRPELGLQSLIDRQRIRHSSLVDSAVMMHGYAALMKSFYSDINSQGTVLARRIWRECLNRLDARRSYRIGSWSGDL